MLCEARAILDHLEETVPEPALLGREPAERAEARRLLAWFDRKFEFEAGGYILHEKMEKRLLGLGRAGPEQPAPRAAMACAPTCSTSTSCCRNASGWPGDGYRWPISPPQRHLSVIDYCGDMPWKDFPAVKTWYMKLKSRPCFRPLLADRWPGLAPPANYDDLDF